MKNNAAKSGDKQTAYGRPRLLTHEEILEGAVQLGLEGLTMKRLATHSVSYTHLTLPTKA